mgnify:CR=1 FL=1
MKRRETLAIFLSAGCFLTGLFSEELRWISWFAFLPLFWRCLDPACSLKRVTLLTLTVGLIYSGAGFFWVIKFDWRLYILIIVLSAPGWMIYFFLLKILLMKIKKGLFQIFGACSLWLIYRSIHQFMPDGTLSTDFAFFGPLPFLQIIRLTGFEGWCAIIIGLNFSAALLIRKRCFSHVLWFLLFTAALLSAYLYGAKKLREPVNAAIPLRPALIQHNLPISGIWRLDHPSELKSEYVKLAREAAEKKPDLIVFPMFDLPEDPLRDPEFLGGLAKETGIPILAAAHVPRSPKGSMLDEGYLSVAVFYSPDEKLSGTYQSVKAAPVFGLLKEWTAEKYTVMKTPLGKLGILLCYEDTSPALAREAVRQDAEMLIALSNPGHFVSTPLPGYHLFLDRLRAIESGRWLARVSANGYSALIDPQGRIIEQSQLGKQEILQLK